MRCAFSGSRIQEHNDHLWMQNMLLALQEHTPFHDLTKYFPANQLFRKIPHISIEASLWIDLTQRNPWAVGCCRIYLAFGFQLTSDAMGQSSLMISQFHLSEFYGPNILQVGTPIPRIFVSISSHKHVARCRSSLSYYNIKMSEQRMSFHRSSNSLNGVNMPNTLTHSVMINIEIRCVYKQA